MANASQRDLILAPNLFAWVLDRTTGQVNVFRGSHKEALSADHRLVVWRSGQYVELAETDDPGIAIQPFIKANEGQYVVLHNPSKGTREMSNGKNGSIPLETGKRVILRGPIEFALWPGQEAEVIDGHRLEEGQYLKIRVTGPIEEADAEALWKLVREEWREQAAGKQAEGETAGEKAAAKERFPLGAEYVVRGSATNFFIPPTGITVVSTNEDDEHDCGEAYSCFTRNGVRLAADEYVTLVNRSGRLSYVYGPTTVIPCIDQEFRHNPQTRTFNFKAVAIDENSGVLLRTLSEMTVAEARQRVPGVQILIDDAQDDAKLPPGTQLVVWKENRLVFPADGVEIIRRFEAEHILAGTARYVKNLLTGKTRVIKGEKLYLADPRVEVLVERCLSQEQVALWFPHGGFDPKLVPCMTVPQGTAAMVLGIDTEGQVTRRVLIGHTIHFLEWDETLAVIKISGSRPGEPKDWKNAVSICYLWTSGNRINDVVKGLRSKDDCEFSLEYTLTVDFDREHSDDWFNVDDYVFLVCEEVRSRLLGALLAYPINDIATNFVGLVRDTVLGKKEGEQHRPGIPFARCGAKLMDINVRSFRISDPDLEIQLKKLQKAGVSDSIKTREAEIALDGEQRRLEIERKKLETSVELQRSKVMAAVNMAEAAEEQKRREATCRRSTEEETLKAEHELERLRAEVEKAKVELQHANAKLRALQKEELEGLAAKLKIATAEAEAHCSDLRAKGELALYAVEQQKARQRLEEFIRQTETNADAMAKVNGSVLPSIASDLHTLADTQMAIKVAEALGRTASFKGMDVNELLAQLAGGSPVVSRALEALKGWMVKTPGSNGSGGKPDVPALPIPPQA